MKNYVEMAMGYAKTHMTGTRKNSSRPAWKHAEDVANLVESAFEEMGLDGRRWIAIAWLHDIIEDCGVREVDLVDAGFKEDDIRSILVLTRQKGESRRSYLKNIHENSEFYVKMVKICDRIANLKEGILTMDRSWIDRYLRETAMYIYPMLEFGFPRIINRLMIDVISKADEKLHEMQI